MYAYKGPSGLLDVPSVGRGIAEKIQELAEKGQISLLDQLRAKYPVKLKELLMVEGWGPARIKVLYQKLGVRGLEELEKAGLAGKIRVLSGFGAKSEERILKSVAFLKAEHGRIPLAMAVPLSDEIIASMRSVANVEEVMVAGSIRRGKETVGDVDVLVVARDAAMVTKVFSSLPFVSDVHEQGEVKASVRHRAGIDVDLRVVKRESLGASLQYFTGSKGHNIALRRLAIEKGLHLNEYGVFRGERRIAGEEEEGVYRALGLPWIPPELRENTGEIEVALRGVLPRLVELRDIKGDLQVQTDWTDGVDSIEEVVSGARAAGLKYIAITDHTKTLAMTGGLDEEALSRQGKIIDQVNEHPTDFRLLKGAEVNIMRDGSLDIEDKTLKELDIVGAAVHTGFNLAKAEMTKRVIKAMENPNVDILFHPTGRLLRQRPPYEINIEEIIETAKATGTILEVNAYPERLDLKDEYAKMAVNRGVKLSIDSDSHSKQQFAFLTYGVTQARRGWASKDHIINTKPVDEMLRSLKNNPS